MPSTYTHEFSSPVYTGKSTINTGLFINNEWVDPVKGETIEVVNPATGKLITNVSIGSAADVDVAVKVARKAFKTTWGLNVPGTARAQLLNKLADLIDANADELAALEALDNGKTFKAARTSDIPSAAKTYRYYAGWAGKLYGKTIETNPAKFAYTRTEPIGVCGQIIPWNYPLMMSSWKIAPALAAGCTVIMKPSENTPLSILRFCSLVAEAGFPPGVVNIINGTGVSVGQAISEHMGIDKVSFTGSTFIGRKIAKAAADSNLKTVTLELGGKSPIVIFDDADVAQAVKWSVMTIFGNAGQTCLAGSRIYVQEGIYDAYLQAIVQAAKQRRLGEQFNPETEQGPQVSKIQLDRVLGYIESGKQQGAKVAVGGAQHGTDGYFVQPTVFTDTNPDMKIVKEEIFGPVLVLVKFKTAEEALELANDTVFGLAAAVFTKDTARAIDFSNKMEAGTVFVNNFGTLDQAMPFGGYKSSGWGRDLGEEALKGYIQTKAVHINIGMKL